MQEPLNELLDHLKAAIEASEHGADNHDELAELAGEVERRLSEDDDEGVVEELQEGARKFSISHPSLADAINRTANALTSIGL
jgi:hypothetical protein